MKRILCAALTVLLLMSASAPAFASGQERYETMAALTEDLYQNGACLLADEISYAYVEWLDAPLNDVETVAGMIANMGIMDFGFEHDAARRRAQLTGIVYYPGFKAAQAWTMGRTDLLNAKEQELLEAGQKLVSRARTEAQSSYELLVRLHDLLIGRVEYVHTGEGRTDLDTAVGALLNGQADCDGYADAFFLLCTLAGFPVRLQHGKGVGQDGEMQWHMWNAVQWDGQWYHVDVTGDDVNFPQEPDATSYVYFMTGNAMMPSHSWVREAAMCRQAEHTDWELYYYTADRTGLTFGAYYETLQDAANYAVYVQQNTDRDSFHVMVDGSQLSRAQEFNDLLIQSGLQGMWYLWGREIGEYTCLSITMLE